jgi:hypothetical protein
MLAPRVAALCAIGFAGFACEALPGAVYHPVPPRDCGPLDSASPPHGYWYVIDSIAIDPTDSPDVAHTGFNVDGLFSGPTDADGCNTQDFVSPLDPDQNCPSVATNGTCASASGCPSGIAPCTGGVDNRLPSLINTIMTASGRDGRRSWPTAIASWEYVLLIHVSGITNDCSGSSVVVSILRGVPDFSDACLRHAPGRSFAVLRSDLVPGATSVDQPRVPLDASIASYRFIVNVAASIDASATLSFAPLFGRPSDLVVRGVQLRAALSPQQLTAGNFGGVLGGDDVIQATIPLMPSYAMLVESAIGGLVDVQLPLYPDPTGICVSTMGTTRTYGGLSIGFGFTAVAATISATTPIADGPLPGRCGSPPTSDAGGPIG